MSRDEYSIRRLIGGGRILSNSRTLSEIVGRSIEPHLTILPFALQDTEPIDSENTSIQTKYGRLTVQNGRKLLSAAAGLPFQDDADSSIQELLLDLSLRRLQATSLSALAPLSAVHDASTAGNETFLQLPCVAEGQDWAVYGTLKAEPLLWDQLLQGSKPLERSTLAVAQQSFAFSVTLSSGALSLETVANVSAGDVIMLRCQRFRVDFHGYIRISGLVLTVRIVENNRRRFLKVIDANAVEPSPDAEPSNLKAAAMFTHDDPEGQSIEAELPEYAAEPTVGDTLSPALIVDNKQPHLSVVVELGEIVVSLAELSSLQVGSLLEVTSLGNHRLTLRTIGPQGSRGDALAYGDLVQVDDSLAMLVTRSAP